MKQATFYLLDNAEPSGALSAHEAVACAVAANGFRAGKRVLIACESQEQAQRLDEALWQREPHEFVPHNLAGEGRTTARRWNCAGPASAATPRAIC